MLRLIARSFLTGETRWLVGSGPCSSPGTMQVASLTSLQHLLGAQGPLPPPTTPLGNCHPAQPSLRLLHREGFKHPRGFTTTASQHMHEQGELAGASQHTNSPQAAIGSKDIVYKGRGMRLFRVLVRMKIFQLTGVAALAIPITTFLSQGEVSPMQAVIASALLVGSGVASTTLWYYSRRYVGELAVLRNPAGVPTAARFSVLDFWGNREDNTMPLAAILPPLQGLLPAVRAVMLSEPLIPIDVEGDRQYFLSIKYGHVLDKVQLMELLEGRLAQRTEQGKERCAADGQRTPSDSEAE